MSMQDPISDMLTRIRNGFSANKESVTLPLSKQKRAIADVLQQEGYIRGYEVAEADKKGQLTVHLKYHNGQPVLEMIKRVSRPSLRVYRSADDLPRVYNGLGVAVISTSQGMMSDRQARKNHIGGEVVCYVA